MPEKPISKAAAAREARLEAALNDAEQTLADGDAPGAERAAKAISAIIRAAAELADWRARRAETEEAHTSAHVEELRERIEKRILAIVARARSDGFREGLGAGRAEGGRG